MIRQGYRLKDQPTGKIRNQRTKVTSEPANEPVTKAEIKNRLGLDDSFTADDDFLDALIAGSRYEVEEHIRRKLINQTIEVRYDQYATKMTLPYPVNSMTSVETIYQGDSTTLTVNDDYYLEGNVIRIVNLTGKSLKIVYTTGYGATAADVPQGIREVIRRLVVHDYQHRGDGIEELGDLGSYRARIMNGLAPYLNGVA